MSDDASFGGETSLSRLLSTLRATLHEETYVFASIPDDDHHLPVPIEEITLFFREPHRTSGAGPSLSSSSSSTAIALATEGPGPGQGKGTAITLILRLEIARKHGIQNYAYPCRMITCDVHSSLEAVGFMAVLATRLAGRGISVNPVSGFYHDHLFVPVERAEEAVSELQLVREEAVRNLETGSKRC
ncbi:uncharacterized protein Z519_11726 [Cladophialophora bantiana CBS 173.52]|uniref:DUF2241 domain-containing protein n=1 Tax=Cladophialophora bantiana (strain ATCC 10958 / CBS 173.52 / CDC B-1940 / NIH 8579) TaxID=1442370 RepID=A0A0D2FM03_CLAB1|nr:uncharacterized protein Z519_11726 [Cladophialophora bantiana CBS 173.52]KIW87752.1 hypothetical protein Z519_11726 [Cladophialophora bantiana CBS 173.52]